MGKLDRLVTVPAQTNMVMIREEYLAVTNGVTCAAAVLNWFERYTMYLSSVNHHDGWVRKDVKDIHKVLLGAFSEAAITRALKLLREMGLLTVAKGGANKWDHKLAYKLVVDALQAALDTIFKPHDSIKSSASIDPICEIDAIKSEVSIGSICEIDAIKSEVSTLEDQSLDQESFDQVFDQEKASASAAAAISTATESRESLLLEKTFAGIREAAQQLHPTPPGSALPPLPDAVGVYEANMGKAGEAIRAEIGAAVAKYGAAVVSEKIKAAALKGGRTWAYVAKMFSDTPAGNYDSTWNDTADDAKSEWRAAIAARQASLAAMTPYERAWGQAYDALELQVNAETWRMWWQDARLMRVDDGVYVVGVGNKYAADYLNKREYLAARRTLRQFAGEGADVRFEVAAVQL